MANSVAGKTGLARKKGNTNLVVGFCLFLLTGANGDPGLFDAVYQRHALAAVDDLGAQLDELLRVTARMPCFQSATK